MCSRLMICIQKFEQTKKNKEMCDKIEVDHSIRYYEIDARWEREREWEPNRNCHIDTYYLVSARFSNDTHTPSHIFDISVSAARQQ